MIKENLIRSIETKRSVTERVDERLIKGDYNDYQQLARDEDTTPEFVAKRAHHLKKEGKLAGDRRTLKTKPEGVSDAKSDTGSAIVDDKIHMQRMEAYRLAGVPEEDIAIMDAGHLDLTGLKKLREDARALRHDKKAEQLAKQFNTLTELEDFEKFHDSALRNGTKKQHYDELMANVREGFDLQEHIAQLRIDDAAYMKRYMDCTAMSDNMAKMREELKTMAARTTEMEGRQSAVEKFFTEIREGKRHSEEIKKIVRSTIDQIAASDAKWPLLVAATYKVLVKYPQESAWMAEAYATGNNDIVRANALRVGPIILEAEEYFRDILKSKAFEPVKKEISNSLWSGSQF